MNNNDSNNHEIVNSQCLMIGDIPIRLIYKNTMETASRNGAVLFYHGLGASKDKQMKELEDLASLGFLAVGIDNVGHGDRKFDDFEERFSETNTGRVNNIISAVRETAAEINLLINGLLDKKMVINSKIGIVGISMGAFIAYAIPMLDDRPKTMVAILGSPTLEGVSISSSNEIEKFHNLSLLSMNAGKDRVVPPEQTRELHLKLKEFYPDYNSRFKYIEYPDSGHFMEEDDWNKCWNKCLEWFKNRS